MANSHYFFHAAVVELLSRAPQLAEADRAALTGDDVPQSLVAATKILNNLLQRPRVVVDGVIVLFVQIDTLGPETVIRRGLQPH